MARAADLLELLEDLRRKTFGPHERDHGGRGARGAIGDDPGQRFAELVGVGRLDGERFGAASGPDQNRRGRLILDLPLLGQYAGAANQEQRDLGVELAEGVGQLAHLSGE